MPRLLTISDDAVPSGYGRIAMSIHTRLVRRGIDVFAASLAYDGLLPPQHDGARLPYWVAPLAGRDWLGEVLRLIPAVKPDAILVLQDAPFLEAVRGAPIDWSEIACIGITPVDGTPIHPRWVDLMRDLDAALTISHFGVEAYRRAGVRVDLCRPGVDTDRFYALPESERAALRARLNIAPAAFVLGTMAMNQGRKCYPAMLAGFFDFARDKPDARYLIDADPVSPAGWDLRALCEQMGFDAGKLIFRADAVRAGLTDLNQRYNLLDAHAVLSHREGFGLPLVESMACGVATLALDYCSGAEICGEGRGALVKPLPYTTVSTWGNALDHHPDVADFTATLTRLHTYPAERRAIAERGMTWARSLSWDAAADAVYHALMRVTSCSDDARVVRVDGGEG